jgi:hypothetical protein
MERGQGQSRSNIFSLGKKLLNEFPLYERGDLGEVRHRWQRSDTGHRDRRHSTLLGRLTDDIRGFSLTRKGFEQNTQNMALSAPACIG